MGRAVMRDKKETDKKMEGEKWRWRKETEVQKKMCSMIDAVRCARKHSDKMFDGIGQFLH